MKISRRASFLAPFFLIIEIFSQASARADTQAIRVSLPLDGVLSNALDFLNGNVGPFITATGILFKHRPFEPATPLGTALGLDFGIEVDIVQVPSSLSESFTKMGVPVTLPPLLPSARMINLHKGVGESADIGGSVFSYNGYLIWGVDIKKVFIIPEEEGLTWAFRFSYNSIYIPIGDTNISKTLPVVGTVSIPINLSASSTSFTPEVIVSKKLDFADPYILIGYTYVTGGVNIINKSVLPIDDISPTGSGGNFFSSLGLSLRVPNVGLRLTLEGTYDASGYNAIGTKVGFSF